MRALVTGASGFIGSHLVDALLARGDEVKAMVRKTSSLDNLAEAKARGAELVYASLSDTSAMAEAMRDVEVVFHSAGLTAANTRDEFDKVNTQGTANVFDAAASAQAVGGGPERVVLISTLEAAGPCAPGVARREYHRVDPFTKYGISKLGGERVAWEVARKGDIEVVIVRPPMVYGPRDKDVLNMFQAAKMRLIAQPGLGHPPVSVIHAHDLVAGTIAAAERGDPLPSDDLDHVLGRGGWRPDEVAGSPLHPAGRGIYYFDDGGQHTIVSFCRAMAQSLDRRALVLPLPGPLTVAVGAISETVGRLGGRVAALNTDKARVGVAPGGWHVSAEKARSELDYCPRYGVIEGTRDTTAWYRARGWL